MKRKSWTTFNVSEFKQLLSISGLSCVELCNFCKIPQRTMYGYFSSGKFPTDKYNHALGIINNFNNENTLEKSALSDIPLEDIMKELSKRGLNVTITISNKM